MMQSMLGSLTSLLLLLAALAPAAADSEAAKGCELAQALCASCHLNDGQGEKQGPMGVPGFVAVANRPGQTLEGIVMWLKAVPPMMPNHCLTQDERFALAAYIMTSASNGYGTSDPHATECFAARVLARIRLSGASTMSSIAALRPS